MSSLSSAIIERYETLAGSSCCLSCGGAVDRAHPQPGETAVDLGCGRGHDALRLADEVGDDGFVYGIDLTEEMLTVARAGADKLGFDNVRFLRGDLQSLPLPDASADLVISNCTINHAEDKQAVWNEIYRILKPGGRFVVSDIYATEPVPERYARNPQAIAECWAGAVTKERYLQQIGRAGFPSIRVLEESEPYPKGAIEVCSWTIAGNRPVEPEHPHPKERP